MLFLAPHPEIMATPTAIPTTPARVSTSIPSARQSDPFASSVDNFFQEPSRIQRLDLLYSLLCYGRSPLVLTGPRGAGKTTLLLQLQKRLKGTQPSALLSVYPELGIEPLLDDAQRQFTAALTAGGLEGAVGAAMLVDDADTLPDQVLRVLLTPVSGKEGQVRVVLTGLSGFGERVLSFMDSTIPRAKILELLPFAEEESARFVRTRLSAAGIHTHPLLLPATLKRLHQDSGGWPGSIVTQARVALAPAAIRPGKVLTPPKKIPSPAKTTRPTALRLKSILLKGLRHAIYSYWLWPTVGILTLAIVFGLWPNENPSTFPAATIPPLSTLPPPPPRLETSLVTPATENASGVKMPPPSPVADPSTTPKHPLPQPDSSGAPSPAPVTTLPTSNPVATSTSPPQNPSVPSPQTVTPATPTSPPANKGSTNFPAEQWLRSQRANHYTLQLMSGNNETDLQEFLRRWELHGEIAIAHTRRQGRDWYSLLYGVYLDYRRAQEAAKQLPTGIPKPWIRTMGSVQKDLP
ncbi:DamX protein [Gammaproteobacteria bacterium]